MNKIFPYFAVTVLALTGCCIIYAQDSGSAKQTNTAKTDIGYSESQPYMPRVFETSNKSKKQKNKKNAPQESAQVTPSVAEKLSADTVITLPVSIFDSRGGFITGLQKSDFKVFVNDVECSVAAVETRNQPLNIILLIDTSPSAYLQINDLQSYALAIVDQLRPQDKAMVLQFNIDMKIMTELTNDHEVLAKGIKKTQGGDGTSLYDTIQEVFSGELKAVMGRKALIILTDGVDTTSRKVSYEQSLVEVERGDVSVFPIYFDTLVQLNRNLPRLNGVPSPIYGTGFGTAVGAARAEYEMGKSYLNDLINLSGGRAIRAQPLAKGQKAVPSKIVTELGLQYYVSFRLPEAPNVGERKQIKIRVNRPGLAVLARGSYIAGN